AAEVVVEPDHLRDKAWPNEKRRLDAVGHDCAAGDAKQNFPLLRRQLTARREASASAKAPADKPADTLSIPRTSCSAAARVGTMTRRSRASSGDPWVARAITASRNAWGLPTRTRRVTRGVITAASVARSGCAFPSARVTAS